MKNDINIAAILRDKPKGTKLFDILRGIDVYTLDNVSKDTTHIYCTGEGNSYNYTNNGGISDDYPNGLQILKPSKEMQDWSKFAWKKGDVLLAGVDNFCIFGGWANDNYTEFHAKFMSDKYSDDTTCKTLDWTKEYNEKTIKQYIFNIEEIKGGKLNLETLEIEKSQFKDGDIVFVNARVFNGSFHSAVFILKNETEEEIYKYAGLFLKNKKLVFDRGLSIIHKHEIVTIRLATDSEKQKLFDALKKEGKCWNPETKTLEDLPKKCEFKAFDKVLVRNYTNEIWLPRLFAYNGSDYIVCTDGNDYKYCIPYNENTAHLLGTTYDYEEGGEE